MPADLLKKYDYSYPPTAIGQRPASPRDAAKLLVYDRTTKQTSISRFSLLPKFLPKNAVLVFNDTKVLPARLRITKPTGGKAELLYLHHDKTHITVLSDRRLDVGWKVTVTPKITLQVISHHGSEYRLRPNVAVASFLRILEHKGTTPLPPYLRHSPLSESERKKMYQTVFAKTKGSVAAPTASLHFTPRLLAALKKRGITSEFVTLHVGLGTFAPLQPENISSGTLHHEDYWISLAAAARLNRYKKEGRPIIAVGTTVVRTLESAARRGRLTKLHDATNLFIREGYRWQFVDGLITNFHVPRSSLLMMVATLTGREKLLQLYRFAINHNFKLFSFGDGMLIV